GRGEAVEGERRSLFQFILVVPSRSQCVFRYILCIVLDRLNQPLEELRFFIRRHRHPLQLFPQTRIAFINPTKPNLVNPDRGFGGASSVFISFHPQLRREELALLDPHGGHRQGGGRIPFLRRGKSRNSRDPPWRESEIQTPF